MRCNKRSHVRRNIKKNPDYPIRTGDQEISVILQSPALPTELSLVSEGKCGSTLYVDMFVCIQTSKNDRFNAPIHGELFIARQTTILDIFRVAIFRRFSSYPFVENSSHGTRV